MGLALKVQTVKTSGTVYIRADGQLALQQPLFRMLHRCGEVEQDNCKSVIMLITFKKGEIRVNDGMEEETEEEKEAGLILYSVVIGVILTFV